MCFQVAFRQGIILLTPFKFIKNKRHVMFSEGFSVLEKNATEGNATHPVNFV
jgi:hypothetical protein